MKLLAFAFAFIIFSSGCQDQKPDYVKTITPAELHQTMENEDIFLVDVHTPEQKHIKGTDLFIPYDAIESNLDKLPKDKNTTVYLYCEGGPMGITAAKKLYDLGYRHLINLDGGTHAWKKAGLALD